MRVKGIDSIRTLEKSTKMWISKLIYKKKKKCRNFKEKEEKKRND